MDPRELASFRQWIDRGSTLEKVQILHAAQDARARGVSGKRLEAYLRNAFPTMPKSTGEAAAKYSKLLGAVERGGPGQGLPPPSVQEHLRRETLDYQAHQHMRVKAISRIATVDYIDPVSGEPRSFFLRLKIRAEAGLNEQIRAIAAAVAIELGRDESPERKAVFEALMAGGINIYNND